MIQLVTAAPVTCLSPLKDGPMAIDYGSMLEGLYSIGETLRVET